MSMNCWLLGLTPVQVRAVMATPQLVDPIVNAASDPAPMIAAMLRNAPPDKRAELEAVSRAMAGALAPRPPVQSLPSAFGLLEPTFCLEKSWHILHYLFTGHADASPAPGDTLLNGLPVGGDIAYGPALLHTPEETRAFDVFLQTQDVERLKGRLDLPAMRGLHIYSLPFGLEDWSNEDEADLRAEVGRAFPALRDFVHDLVRRGDGMLVWLS